MTRTNFLSKSNEPFVTSLVWVLKQQDEDFMLWNGSNGSSFTGNRLENAWKKVGMKDLLPPIGTVR